MIAVNKKKSHFLIVDLLCLYFLIIFLYGIVIKLTIHNPVLFNLKTYLPETLLGLAILFSVLKYFKTMKFKLNNILFFLYFALVLAVNLITAKSIDTIFMTIRDVFIPITCAFIFSSINFEKALTDVFFKRLDLICIVFVISGLVLGLIQLYHGGEWTSKFYTGYSFWGNDEKSSLFVMYSSGILRVPSVTGHNVKFAMYSFFALLVMIQKPGRSKIFKFILSVMCVINIYISNNKTTLVAAFLILFLYCIRKYKLSIKLMIFLPFTLICSVIGLYLENNTNFWLSLNVRFQLWSELNQNSLVKNIFLPLNTYSFSGNSDNANRILNIWDNSYLYFLFAFGILGVILLIRFIYRGQKLPDYSNEDQIRFFIKYLTIFTAIAALTTNIILGRCFFNILMILLGIYVSPSVHIPGSGNSNNQLSSES